MLRDIALAFCDAVKRECTEHYDNGGHYIIECFGNRDIVDRFSSMPEVVEYCGLWVENALNARWGESCDPELKAFERWKEWRAKWPPSLT